MIAYLLLRRWVDEQWVEVSGYKSLGAVAVLLGLPLVAVGVVWYLALLLTVLWTVLIAWRGVRVARANDANYDRKTKHSLSADYRESESALKAAFKRRRRDVGHS